MPRLTPATGAQTLDEFRRARAAVAAKRGDGGAAVVPD